MRKLLLIFAGIAGFAALHAQTLTPQVVANSGTSFSGASGGMEFTIGEVATSTLSASGDVLTQGFNQPNIVITAVEEFVQDLSIKLFPNPTQQFLNLETEANQEFQVSIFDAAGKKVFDTMKFNHTLSVDVNGIAAGKYFLRVDQTNGQPVKNFTFIKISQ